MLLTWTSETKAALGDWAIHNSGCQLAADLHNLDSFLQTTTKRPQSADRAETTVNWNLIPIIFLKLIELGPNKVV